MGNGEATIPVCRLNYFGPATALTLLLVCLYIFCNNCRLLTFDLGFLDSFFKYDLYSILNVWKQQ